MRSEASFIPAPGDERLCKDQAHDAFMSYLTLEIDCNWTSLLHESAAAGFESLSVGFDETDVCQRSFQPCRECDPASNRTRVQFSTRF